MKQTFFLMFFCLASALLFGQIPAGPVYLLFNSACMNQLEYRYAYSGAQVLAYSIQSAPDKHLILYSGSNGVNATELPAAALDCASMKFDPAFVDAVNKSQKQVFMVHQTQTGYLMMPLIAALQVERNGSYFFFRGANYQFAIDTLNLISEANLSAFGSPNLVYFAGLQIKNCLYQYAFRGEPMQAGKEKMDFEFIPGIGMISERTGMTANDMESNQTRLWFVNGMSLDDYIAQKCGTQDHSNQLPLGGTYLDRPTAEKPQPIPTPVPAVGPCPESSGPGYHIVQPKETLMAISRQYKVPLASLIKWNAITAPDKIEICQKIFVVNPATLKSATPARPPVTPRQPPILEMKPAPKPATPLLHTVKQGESLFSIAKLYNFTETQLRQFNGFPQSGSITLYPGQKILLSETEPGTAPMPAASLPLTTPLSAPPASGGNNPAPTPLSAPPASGGYNPAPTPLSAPPASGGYSPAPPPSTAPPASGGYNPAPAPSTAPPASGGYNPAPPPSTAPPASGGYNPAPPPSTAPPASGGYNPAPPPSTAPPASGGYNPAPPPSTSAGAPPKPSTYNVPPPVGSTPQNSGSVFVPPGTNNPSSEPPQSPGRMTIYQEYVVQKGDTMQSVAKKFKTTAQELALINNKEVNETLIAGQRILAPK